MNNKLSQDTCSSQSPLTCNMTSLPELYSLQPSAAAAHIKICVGSKCTCMCAAYVCERERHAERSCFGGYDPSETSLTRELSPLFVIEQHLLTDAQRPAWVDDHSNFSFFNLSPVQKHFHHTGAGAAFSIVVQHGEKQNPQGEHSKQSQTNYVAHVHMIQFSKGWNTTHSNSWCILQVKRLTNRNN